MNRTSLRHLIGTGLAAMALSVSAVAIASPAGAADAGTTARHARHRWVHLTDTQKQCMKDQGITRPIRPLTPEKITALKAAAKACGISRSN
jgi:Spy/CpxP family protein refolding chaperone